MKAKEYYKSTRMVETRNWTLEMVFNFAEEYANSIKNKQEIKTTCLCAIKHRDLKELQSGKCMDCGGTFKK